MNRNKIEICLEIIYNCPFLLLVMITSLVFVLFFDEKGVLKTDKSITVFQPENQEEAKADEENKGGLFDIETFIKGYNSDNALKEKKEAETGEADNAAENAGTRRNKNDEIKSETSQKVDIASLKTEINRKKEENRATKFVEYTPIETDSRYYSDAGKVALTTAYDYALENESYFNDAAFLGDSRTLGISDYAGLDGADFFCDNGMTIYKLLEDAGVTYQKTGEKVDLKEILQEKHYGKIYIMLGMNELGYGDTRMYLRQYLKVLGQIREWQPEAVIYIMANLHVSREKNNMESEFNNININDKNVASARLANGRDIFYLDCNPLFTDGEGYLLEDLTFDGVHLYAQHYEKWRDFLFEHGVEKTAEELSEDGESGTQEEAEDIAHGGDTAE